MQMVPPVITIRTRLSGVAILFRYGMDESRDNIQVPEWNDLRHVNGRLEVQVTEHVDLLSYFHDLHLSG